MGGLHPRAPRLSFDEACIPALTMRVLALDAAGLDCGAALLDGRASAWTSSGPAATAAPRPRPCRSIAHRHCWPGHGGGFGGGLAVTVTVGPGSFTGLRGALALAHGTGAGGGRAGGGGDGWRRPCCTALVHWAGPVWVALDARRAGRIFLDPGGGMAAAACWTRFRRRRPGRCWSWGWPRRNWCGGAARGQHVGAEGNRCRRPTWAGSRCCGWRGRARAVRAAAALCRGAGRAGVIVADVLPHAAVLAAIHAGAFPPGEQWDAAAFAALLAGARQFAWPAGPARRLHPGAAGRWRGGGADPGRGARGPADGDSRAASAGGGAGTFGLPGVPGGRS